MKNTLAECNECDWFALGEKADVDRTAKTHRKSHNVAKGAKVIQRTEVDADPTVLTPADDAVANVVAPGTTTVEDTDVDVDDKPKRKSAKGK